MDVTRVVPKKIERGREKKRDNACECSYDILRIDNKARRKTSVNVASRR